jgi:hypothetical protein
MGLRSQLWRDHCLTIIGRSLAASSWRGFRGRSYGIGRMSRIWGHPSPAEIGERTDPSVCSDSWSLRWCSYFWLFPAGPRSCCGLCLGCKSFHLITFGFAHRGLGKLGHDSGPASNSSSFNAYRLAAATGTAIGLLSLTPFPSNASMSSASV